MPMPRLASSFMNVLRSVSLPHLHRRTHVYPLTTHNLHTHHTAANMADHDELHAEQTEGFKVGEKKTIDEYQKLGPLPYPPA